MEQKAKLTYAHEFEHPKPSIWIPPDSHCTCPDCSSWRCILPVIVYCEIKQRKQKQHPKHYFPMTYVTYRGAARGAGWKVGWHPTNPRNPQHSPGKKTPSGLERPGRTQRTLAPDVHTHLHTCISTYILTNMHTHIIAHTCIRAIIIMIIVRGTHLQPWIWCVCARLHKYNISMKAFYIYDGRLIKHRRRTLLTLSPPQDSGANLALNIHSWVQPHC